MVQKQYRFAPKSIFTFALLCFVAIVVVLSTSSLVQIEESLDPIEVSDKFKKHDKKIVIFPNNFESDSHKLASFFTEVFGQKLNEGDIVYKNRDTYELPQTVYNWNTIDLFRSIGEKDSLNCETIPLNFETSKIYNKNADLYKILRDFKDENSFYYKEVSVFFPDLAKQLQERTIKKHWFQLIGSSVWLELYGIHLMISRVIYTKTGNKVQPVISLSYVQAFDRNWTELQNVTLIVPDDSTGKFKTVTYPSFMPIPVYHNVKQQRGKFYGVEDPRIILVKNKQGYEEPLIVYNSFNRNSSNTNYLGEIKNFVKLDTYRSIFMAWIWRSQVGKNNVGLMIPGTATTNDIYVKVKELSLPDKKKSKTEKNWTPLVIYEDQKMQGYDSHIYFIYLFEDLSILKCSLWDTENCVWEYRMNNKKTKISELRGGTELMNVNQILDKHNFDGLEIVKDQFKDKEVWIGFARAALSKCGCGVKMYRPNFTMLVRQKGSFQLSFVSSYMDFGVPILPWTKGKGLCNGKNLLIPNGISNWVLAEGENGSFQDYMTLSLSRSDSTVDIIHIKGILKSILSEYLLHTSRDVLNNNAIHCALLESESYCKSYAENYKAHLKRWQN